MVNPEGLFYTRKKEMEKDLVWHQVDLEEVKPAFVPWDVKFSKHLDVDIPESWQDIDTNDPSSHIYLDDNRLDRKQPNYINMLPDEIWYSIFRHAIKESGLDEIISYLLISKRTRCIVAELARRKWKDCLFGIQGVTVNHLYHLKRGLVDYFSLDIIHEGLGPESRSVKYIEKFSLHFRKEQGIDLLRSYIGRNWVFVTYNCLSYNSTDMCHENREGILFPDHIIWNHGQLTIIYPVRYIKTVNFSRLYRKEYFTADDILERVNHFYQSAFTSQEYSHFIKSGGNRPDKNGLVPHCLRKVDYPGAPAILRVDKVVDLSNCFHLIPKGHLAADEGIRMIEFRVDGKNNLICKVVFKK